MAQPNTIKGTKVHILTSNGATPAVYTAYCGLTAKNISFTKRTNDVFVPDCDNPDDPAWRELAVSGKSATITGSGSLDMNALARYQAAWDASASMDCRMEIGVPLASHGGYWDANWALTRFEIVGNQDGLATVNLTFESDGAVAWVPATS